MSAGGPVVKTPAFQADYPGSTPGRRMKPSWHLREITSKISLRCQEGKKFGRRIFFFKSNLKRS